MDPNSGLLASNLSNFAAMRSLALSEHDAAGTKLSRSVLPRAGWWGLMRPLPRHSRLGSKNAVSATDSEHFWRSSFCDSACSSYHTAMIHKMAILWLNLLSPCAMARPQSLRGVAQGVQSNMQGFELAQGLTWSLLQHQHRRRAFKCSLVAVQHAAPWLQCQSRALGSAGRAGGIGGILRTPNEHDEDIVAACRIRPITSTAQSKIHTWPWRNIPRLL